MPQNFNKDRMYYSFCLYGFLKNLNFFEPFLLLFFLEKGFSYLQIGTLYAIQSIATNILEIPTGIMADAVGRRRTMVFSMLSYLIAFPIFYFSRSFAFFALAMLGIAFGDAFRTGTHKAMIFEYLKIKGWKDQKVHYYGHTRSWSQMGSALSALIAAGIVFYSGNYSAIFLASMVPYVLDLLLLLTYPRELDGDHKDFHPDRLGGNFSRTVSDFLVSMRSPTIIRGVANSASYAGYFDALKDYLQPILKSFALSLPVLVFIGEGMEETKKSALIIGFMYFLINLSTSRAARYSGRYAEGFKELSKPMNLTLAAGLSFGIAAGLAYAFGLAPVTLLLFLGLYLIHNLRRPLGEAYITETLKSDILASALSTESQAITLVTAVLAPIIGLLADLWGIGIAIAAVSVAMLASLPLYRAKILQGEP